MTGMGFFVSEGNASDESDKGDESDEGQKPAISDGDVLALVTL
jgi:hypothetical protein